jgi:hypothetical protein
MSEPDEQPMRAETYVVGGGTTREDQLLADLVRANDEITSLRDEVARLERLLSEALGLA